MDVVARVLHRAPVADERQHERAGERRHLRSFDCEDHEREEQRRMHLNHQRPHRCVDIVVACACHEEHVIADRLPFERMAPELRRPIAQARERSMREQRHQDHADRHGGQIRRIDAQHPADHELLVAQRTLAPERQRQHEAAQREEDEHEFRPVPEKMQRRVAEQAIESRLYRMLIDLPTGRESDEAVVEDDDQSREPAQGKSRGAMRPVFMKTTLQPGPCGKNPLAFRGPGTRTQADRILRPGHKAATRLGH